MSTHKKMKSPHLMLLSLPHMVQITPMPLPLKAKPAKSTTANPQGIGDVFELAWLSDDVRAIKNMIGTSGCQRVPSACFNTFWLAVPLLKSPTASMSSPRR